MQVEGKISGTKGSYYVPKHPVIAIFLTVVVS